MTDPTTGHTPTPWSMPQPGVHPFIVATPSGLPRQLVADLSTVSEARDEQLANAALIVRTVNSHDAQLRALQGLVAQVAERWPDANWHTDTSAWGKPMREALAALALARGGK